MNRTTIVGWSCAALAVACASAQPAAKKAIVLAPPPPPASCAARLHAALAPKPVLARQGSTVALAKSGDRTLAFAADEDDGAVRVVDVDGAVGKAELAEIDLDGRPSQLAFTGDGRLAVAIRDKSELELFELTGSNAAPLEKLCDVATEAEPVGLALSPDGSRILVATGWSHTLASYDLASPTLARAFSVSLPREPRAVLVSGDGQMAFVSHAVGGQLSVVELASGRVVSTPTHPIEQMFERRGESLDRAVEDALVSVQGSTPPPPRPQPQLPIFSRGLSGSSCQGFALASASAEALGGVHLDNRIFAPQVLVDPGDPRERPSGYGSNRSDQTEVPDVAVFDGKSGKLLLASLEPREGRMVRMFRGSASVEHAHEECLLPRAAAFDAGSGSLLVTCFGIDAVVAYDALAASPARAETRRWHVPAGPNGIAVEADKRRAIVWSQFERTLTRIALGDGKGPALSDEVTDKPPPLAHIALAGKKEVPMAYAFGRVLFHLSGDSRISHDGRACASCHPDGRDDSLVWATPNGPRRSIMLAGRVADTAPFSWSGTENDLKEHMEITFTRLKGGGGLKGVELDALAAYVQTMHPPPAERPPAERDADSAIARGRAIFASAAAGCGSCHSGPLYTDNRRHDVQSKTAFDRSGEFNTPSLHLVANHAPYFHDGRYPTLHGLLIDSDRKMGHTKQLSEDEVAALEAYLRSL